MLSYLFHIFAAATICMHTYLLYNTYACMCLYTGYIFAICKEAVKKFVILPFKLCFMGMMPSHDHIKELPCELNEGKHATEPTNYTTFKEMNQTWKSSDFFVHDSRRIAPNHLCNGSGYLFIFSEDKGYISIAIEQTYKLHLQPVEEIRLHEDIKELVIGMIGFRGPNKNFTL